MANKKIKRLLRITIWVLSGTGLVVLLIAAMSRKNEQICKGAVVQMKGGEGQSLFIDRKDILNLLTANGGRKIKGKSLASIDLKMLEASIEKNVWISNAELFFDKDAFLQVHIQENVPVARLFTVNGSTCYIDSSGNRLPLSDKFSARLPVFTGFPSERTRLSKQDSVVMERVKDIARFLHEHPFWMSQIAQVDITQNRQFELYPLIGNHVIELGDGLDLENRFKRLMIFYQQVMKETGPQAWARLKVQYARQVIGIKQGAENVPVAVTGAPVNVPASVPVQTQTAQAVPPKPPVRTTTTAGPAGTQPRAVMPAANRRNNN